MNGRYQLLILIVLFLWAMPSYGDELKHRQRVSLTGTSLSDVYTVAEGEESPSSGEMFFVKVEVKANEDIMVQIHQYCRPSTLGGLPVAEDEVEFRPSPASEGKFKSKQLTAATSRLEFKANDSGAKSVGIFFPYHATAHAAGTYQIRYRIRVWVNKQLLDDYYLSVGGWALVRPEETIRIFRLGVPLEGPEVRNFRVVGSTDPEAAPTPQQPPELLPEIEQPEPAPPAQN